MEFFKFGIWFWNKQEGIIQFLLAFIPIIAIASIVGCFAGGNIGIAVFGILFVIEVVLVAIYHFCLWIYNSYIEYKAEREVEAQEIIDKLSGRDIYRGDREDRMKAMIKLIRQRSRITS